MSLTLSGITTANLTDTRGGGGNTFTINGWTGKGSLSGSSDSLVESVSSNVTLTNASLAVTGIPALTLYGITTANLTDTAGGNTFTVSGWTGNGSLTDTATTADTVTASKSAGFTLTNSLLSSTDGMSLSLSNGITTANLTDNGSGGNTFTASGWTGGGTLKGATETLVDSISSNVALSNTSLAVTGGATLTLSGFTRANLTDTAGGNTFTVSGWTRGGSLTDNTANVDAVAATKAANYTLTNTSLASGDGMSLTLSAIVTANLAVTGAGHIFTESGWTGSGSLTGTTATVAASNASGFTVSPTSLTAGPMSLTLSGITTANLTDTRGGGGNTFTINGWTGKGSLSGSSDSLVESVSSNVTLTNASLAVTGIPALTLYGITTANLTDTAGGNTFTVSGWTGNGSLTDTATTADTVTASKSAGFTLTNSLLSSTDGMSLSLSNGITTANLTDNGSGGNTFTVSGWTGGGTLKGATETLVDSISSNVALSNTSLAVTGGATLTLNGFTAANLTDTSGGTTFTVSGWSHAGSLTDNTVNADTVAATKAANYTLANTSLSSTDGLSLGLTGINIADLAVTGAGTPSPRPAGPGPGR